MVDPKRHIIQIIPADDWYVVHLTEVDPYYELYAVACFALVEDETHYRFVTGLDGADTIDFADEDSGFHCYIRKDELDDEMRKGLSDAGRKHMEAEKARAEAARLKALEGS